MTLLIVQCLGLSLLLGPMGCFMVWRRLSFYADSLSHSILLGAGVALVLKVNIWVGMVLLGATLSICTSRKILQKNHIEDGWLLGITATMLAAGVILISYFKTQVSPESILFGDLLTASHHDIQLIWILFMLNAFMMLIYWKTMMVMSLHQDIAIAEKTARPYIIHVIVFLITASTVLTSTAIGALFVPAFLVLPALAARPLARSPEEMIVLSIVILMMSFFIGVQISYYYDLSTNAVVVLCLTSLNFFTKLLKKFIFKKHTL